MSILKLLAARLYSCLESDREIQTERLKQVDSNHNNDETKGFSHV
jgi:hypothetical protein